MVELNLVAGNQRICDRGMWIYRVATVHGTVGCGVRPYYHEFGFLLLGKRDDPCRIHSDKGKTEIGSEDNGLLPK
jgi:hypothetical protein